MKTLISTITLIIATAFLVQAQEMQGYAIYKTQSNMEIQLDSTQISSEMHQQMMAMMKKQFEKEYTLSFTKDESVFKENEKLDSPKGSMGGGGVMVVIAGSGAADVLYKNIKEQRFANQNELFGKEFLIADSIPKTEWTLSKESKNIGQYTCFKASYKRTDTIRTSFNSNLNGDESESGKEEVRETEIIAWYTPQIPLSHGPRMFDGLPGLILEIDDGNESILCSKIVLNPKDGVAIDEPKKGKKVSQEEYDMILEKKLKEQAEQFGQDGRRRQDGSSFSIRIGG